MIESTDVIFAYAIGRGVSREVAEREVEDPEALARALEEQSRGESAAIEHELGVFVIQGLEDPESGHTIPMHVVFYPDEPPELSPRRVSCEAASLEMAIAFERALDPAERRAVEASIPPPLIAHGWSERSMRFGSDEGYAIGVKEAVYAEEGDELDHDAIAAGIRDAMVPNDEEWAAFDAIVGGWLARLHAVFPIAEILRSGS